MGQHSTSEGLPGEVAVGQEPGKRALDERQARRGPAHVTERFRELPPPLRTVEIAGERRDRAPVQVELATRVPTRREEQHRPSERRVQLVLGELDLRACDECEGDDAFVLTARCEHLLDLAEDVAHDATRYDQVDEGRAFRR